MEQFVLSVPLSSLSSLLHTEKALPDTVDCWWWWWWWFDSEEEEEEVPDGDLTVD